MDTGTTAFMLCSIIGLTLMIPGLALFYGGMVSVKSSVNMMMMTYGAVAIVGLLWFVFGFSLVFGDSLGGFLGDPTDFFGSSGMFSLDGSTDQTSVSGLSLLLFSLFQALFACITVALISGAAADRMKFSAWMVFATVWAVVVYFPVAHWVFSFDGVISEKGGWIANKLGALDFAGGTAVHINAGAAALAVAIVLGKSANFGKGTKPHSVPLTLLGAGLLWAGWYAFNGGSWLGASDGAAFAMVTSFLATCAATLAWLGVEKWKDGHVTGIGAASGAITGLVAITPSCGDVTPMGAILVGLVAGAICPLAVGLKERFGYDDSLDVVGVHLVGGVIGTLMIGVVGSAESVQGVEGLLYGGGLDQLWKQFLAAAAVLVYSFVISLGIALAIKKTMGIRISPEDEEVGIDARLHRDPAYELI
ncbi:ammonium transporter [Nocardioides daeguensis]|uniref:Ammonium transporter n=1 Tax=Nocardioides daeguensis TaxID=908359 RepID=A0ABP6VKX5_9ACTN|nr:ammonium transporter [Nocardioides daeguensis]MBV6729003.1 ammonium transporter [Nocardioides daeguensis]MCR1773524.1 ammonium transporter [Nocardioides daeguensis]